MPKTPTLLEQIRCEVANLAQREYIYNASGTKIKKQVKDGSQITTTDYVDGFQYTNGILDFFPHAEGYVKYNSNNIANIYSYVFHHTDHLGNIRLRYTRHPRTGDLAILEENHYYPFGLTHSGYNSNHQVFSFEDNIEIDLIPVTPNAADAYRYKYNGKEFQDELSLNVYDYGARIYTPDAPRFWQADPLAEKYPSISPYVYVANNPINAIDPDGRLIIFINGFHFGDGGRSEYWNGLDSRLQKRIGDTHARYYDGGLGGIYGSATNYYSGVRRRAGKRTAYKQAAEIFSSLAEGETIKIATHSMGGAYGKGFIQGLRKYAKKNDIDITDLIEFEVDLAPFQPSSQQADDDVPTTVIAHEGDWLAGSEPMPGTEDNNVTRKGKKKSLSEHYVDSFTQDEINRLVPESKQTGQADREPWEQKPKKN